METNVIYNQDCLEGMKELPDNSIDLVVMDPPYEIVAGGSGGAFGKDERDYHNEIERKDLHRGISNEVFDELIRVMKQVNLYTFCNKNQILQILNYFKEYNYDLLAYHKTNPIPTCNNKYLSDTEYIIFVREPGVGLNGTYETKKKYFIQKNAKNDYEHPTVKPLNIIKKLVTNSSEKGDIVLDPFMGSGTTAVASVMLERQFLGYEINSDYIDIAYKRLGKLDKSYYKELPKEKKPKQAQMF